MCYCTVRYGSSLFMIVFLPHKYQAKNRRKNIRRARTTLKWRAPITSSYLNILKLFSVDYVLAHCPSSLLCAVCIPMPPSSPPPCCLVAAVGVVVVVVVAVVVVGVVLAVSLSSSHRFASETVKQNRNERNRTETPKSSLPAVCSLYTAVVWSVFYFNYRYTHIYICPHSSRCIFSYSPYLIIHIAEQRYDAIRYVRVCV